MWLVGKVRLSGSNVANITVGYYRASVGRCQVLGMPVSTISRCSNKPKSCAWQPSRGFPGDCPTVVTIGRLIYLITSENAMGIQIAFHGKCIVAFWHLQDGCIKAQP